MVTFKYIEDGAWQGISTDPQELAEAISLLMGSKPDPECYRKVGEEFHGVVQIPAFVSLPWKEVVFKGRRDV